MVLPSINHPSPDQKCIQDAQGNASTSCMRPFFNLPAVCTSCRFMLALPALTQALLLVAAMSSLHNHVADMAPAVFSQLDKLPTKPDLGASGPFVHPDMPSGYGCAAWSILCWNWLPCYHCLALEAYKQTCAQHAVSGCATGLTVCGLL
jgi:hypothetical protein